MQSLETKSSRPRPKSFETETRPETFETETPKIGASRYVSRPKPSLEAPSLTVSYVMQYMYYLCSKDTIPLKHQYIQPYRV